MIRVELKGFAEAVEIWGSKPVRKAAVSALRKVANRAVTLASKEVRDVFTIQKKDLDPRIKRDSATGSDLTEVIVLSGAGLPLSLFRFRAGAGNVSTTRGKAGGIKAKTLKRSARVQGVEAQVMADHTTKLRSAFLIDMRTARKGFATGTGIMQRRTSKRLPLREKLTISVAGMVRHVKVQPAVLQKVQEEWGKVFDQELNYQLNVKGKRP